MSALSAWGLDPEEARALDAVIVARGVDLSTATTEASRALAAAVISATELHRFAAATRKLLDVVTERQASLDAYDCGRLFHLKGLVAWRVEGSISSASRALTHAERLLRSCESPSALAYLPRVLDTRGQLLHADGMLAEARRDLEGALALREALGDEEGLAITLGNLGRLCLDLGDFESARAFFSRDLALVERTTPERTRIRTQLATHLAQCETACGRPTVAVEIATRAAHMAREGGDAIGESFATLALGRAKLALGDAPGAIAFADVVRGAATDATSLLDSELRAHADHLSADAHATLGELDVAASAYRRAHQALASVPRASPMEVAEILTGLARALAKSGAPAEATARFRDALHHLDATAAARHRAEIERELKAHSLDAWLLHSAGRFIGQHHVQRLLAEAGNEGFRGTRKEVVALFSDIRGFTTLSERLEPEELIATLNDLLTSMTRCIERHGGTIDKFIGDAVMAVFPGEPEHDDGPALAALAMQDELERFNWGARATKLAIGIGLHRGPVVAGLIGSPQKREYTIIGDVVNTASRLEGMTKQLGARTLVSEAVKERLEHPERLLLRPLGRFAPKGRARALAVYDLMGERDGSAEAVLADEEIEEATMAEEQFVERRFTRAAELFEALRKKTLGTGRDAGYELLRDAARAFVEEPPPSEWSGEIALATK